MGALLQHLVQLPPVLIYALLAAGAAVENVFPPVPADTFVLLGAFLASAGRANPWLVLLFTWLANVLTAVGVYAFAYQFGEAFFGTRIGRFLLHPRQLEQIGGFYRRWGLFAIFGSRFLPAFRAMVPVFAGVTRVSIWRVLPPLALASGLWYGALVYLGALAGGNWRGILSFFDRASLVLELIAGVLIVAFTAWWLHSRRHHRA
ncbi:MAG: DedA family protein [Gemmatimonadetes bacterium]|nr:DedA family protein [Gemmatimonadota bacterium]